MKRLVILILCFILTIFELIGCKNGRNDDIPNSNDSNANHNEENAGTDFNESNNKDNDIFNDSYKGELHFRDERLVNYMEKQIPIEKMDSAELFATSIVLNEEGYFEYYTISDAGGNTTVWKYILEEDGNWKREGAEWLNGLKNKIDQKRITVFLGEDENYYAHYVEKGERSHLVKKDRNGFIEIPIPDWDITEDRDYYMIPDQVAVLKNGNIVMASRTGICYIYNKDNGEIMDTFSCGHYFSMITNDNYIIVLDDEDQSALVYDTEQGRIINKIYGDFEPETVFYAYGDTLYACCKQGVLKTGLLKDSWEVVLEAGTFRFANQASCRFFVKELDFYVLYFGDFSTLMNYTKRTEDERIEEELIIFSLQDNTVIREMIVEFQLKHPEIQIIYEVGEIESGSAALSDSIRALNTRIMNGEGPDIFLLEGLPINSYVKKGILADLQDGMKEYKEQLHQGIKNVYTADNGAVYMFPVSISLPVFYTVPESEKAMSSLNDLVELSESMEESLTYEMTFDDAVYLLYHYYLPEIISEEDGVLESNLKEFMEQVKRFCISEDVFEVQQGEYSYSQLRGGLHKLAKREVLFVFDNMKGIGHLYNTPALLKEIEGKIHSNQNSFIPIGLLGINRASRKQAEAFLFLKEVLSYDIQNKVNGNSIMGFPVNQLAIEEMRKIDNSKHIITWINRNGSEVVARMHNEEDASEIVDMINCLDKSWLIDETIIQILQKEAVPYLKGDVGIEDTVETIKNRLELYLFE